jgi:hypothetical protein
LGYTTAIKFPYLISNSHARHDDVPVFFYIAGVGAQNMIRLFSEPCAGHFTKRSGRAMAFTKSLLSGGTTVISHEEDDIGGMNFLHEILRGKRLLYWPARQDIVF